MITDSDKELIKKAERIKAVMSQSGWRDIEQLIKDIYSVALSDILNGADDKSIVSARFTIKALDEFMHRLTGTTQRADVLKKELVEERNNEMQKR